MGNERAQTLQLNAIFALAYFGFAGFGLMLATLNHSASPVWPATGLAFYMIRTYGWRLWPAIAIGAFAANLHGSGAVLPSLSIAFGNTAEALLGAFLMMRVLRLSDRFAYQTETFAIVAAAGASVLSASVGLITLYMSGDVAPEMMARVWLTWWIGDALGGLVVTPLLIQLHQVSWRRIGNIHSLGVFICGLAAIYFIFFQSVGNPFLFLLFPVLLYAAYSVGATGVLLTAVFLCGASIGATVLGQGPFAAGSLNDRLIHLQLFLVAIAVTALMLAGFVRAQLSRLPALVLLLCWIISGALFYSFEVYEKSQDRFHFQSLVNELEGDILRRMQTYEEALRGGVGLYAASKAVEMKEWKVYNQILNITGHYPGINGFGVVWPVKHSDLVSFERKLRTQGLVDFKVRPAPGYKWPAPPPPVHYVTQFIEPIAENFPALGRDFTTEPHRRAAAEQARDTGKGTITTKVNLFHTQAGTGFLFFLPIYRPNLSLETLEERRRAHLGWVYGPLNGEKFFGQILTKNPNQVDLDVFDGVDTDPEDLIFKTNPRSDNRPYEAIAHIELGQRQITLGWRRGSQFPTSHNLIIAWVGLCGALVSLLLTNVVVGLQVLNQRSREMAVDLTKELVEAQKKQEEDNQFLLKVAELAPYNLYIIDFQTRLLIYSNSNVFKTLGYSLETMRDGGKDFAKQVIHPDDWETTWNRFGILEKSADGEILNYLNRLKDASGRWHWMQFRESVFKRNSSGAPEQIIGACQDITDMKDAEAEIRQSQEKLKESERRLTYALEGSSDGIWDWDLVQSEVYLSEKLAHLFGIDQTVKMNSGADMTAFVHPEDLEATGESIRRHLAGEIPVHEVETRMRLKTGEWRWVLTRGKVSERAADGTPVRMTGVHIDIDRLKKAEVALEISRQEALEATKIKSQFLATMSHEIRTPINGIIGMAGLLTDTPLSPQQKEYAQAVNRSAESLLALINDILDFSKVEAGKLDLEIIDFDLHHLLGDLHRSFSFQAQQKNLVLNLDAKFNRAAYKGDPGRIRQVLNNLIGNAIKFTPHGHVTLKCQVLKEQNQSTTLRFEIVDTGIGIPEATISRLFQAFSQADSTTSRRFGGTGLGLSISKRLVEMMGGRIGVLSTKSQGSTFWFELNLDHGEQTPISTSNQGPLLPKRAARILIAEDNPVNQIVALETLKKLGYRPHAVANGNEVLDALREIPYDLVLMDCQMPEMDGFEATKVIRSSQSLNRQQIPIIAMTANAMKGDREKCLAAGMDDYVSKPVKDTDLFAAIEKWVDKEEKGPLKRAHILVAEDNPVNQTVICSNLEKLSYSFDVAVTGAEAVAMLKANTYDLVLMDCNMPEMDGYQATQAIRQLKDPERSQITIVALTANAMKGDREKCLAAGMDDYLTKPFKNQDLARTLEKWLAVNETLKIARKQQEKQMESQRRGFVIDPDVLDQLRSLQKPGAPDILQKLVTLFLESAEETLTTLRAAVQNNDKSGMSTAAHSLKSSCANLGAVTMSQLCSTLEKIGNGLLNEDAKSVFANLETEFLRLFSVGSGMLGVK